VEKEFKQVDVLVLLVTRVVVHVPDQISENEHVEHLLFTPDGQHGVDTALVLYDVELELKQEQELVIVVTLVVILALVLLHNHELVVPLSNLHTGRDGVHGVHVLDRVE